MTTNTMDGYQLESGVVDTNFVTTSARAILLRLETELANKEAQLVTIVAKIADAKDGLSRPTSESFWSDLVTDASGPSFHRFQMIAWTVILGILFLASVYKNLAMPVFSGTMLALMGISAGTYLGFKIPEKQNSADPDKAAAEEKAKAEAAAKEKETEELAEEKDKKEEPSYGLRVQDPPGCLRV